MIPISDYDVQTLLQEALEEFKEEQISYRLGVTTFEEAGILCTQKGLVLRTADREWQISIIRSK